MDEGPLSAILIPAGTENVKVNTPIAVIGEADAAPAPKAREAPEAEAPAELFAAPAVVTAAVAPDVEIPEGTEMVTMTVREAIRAALSEEMRRDPYVFLMGEEWASTRAPTRFPGHARRVRSPPRDRHADHRAWLHGPCSGRGLCGLKPVTSS